MCPKPCRHRERAHQSDAMGQAAGGLGGVLQPAPAMGPRILAFLLSLAVLVPTGTWLGALELVGIDTAVASKCCRCKGDEDGAPAWRRPDCCERDDAAAPLVETPAVAPGSTWLALAPVHVSTLLPVPTLEPSKAGLDRARGPPPRPGYLRSCSLLI